MGDWLLANASVKGASHINSGSPCQDASIVRTDHSGKWLIAVASDGAGSASRADEGADFVASKFANALTELSQKLESRSPGSWTSDFVIRVILETRSYLRDRADDAGPSRFSRDRSKVAAPSHLDSIQDFNCTLVACLLGPSGGFSIHIGDGAIFGQRQDRSSTNGSSPDNVNYVSRPENGEYANETYFLTESDWIKHLRITPMPALNWVLLCTDGGAALSMRDETEPKCRFLFPVLSELIDAKDDHQRDSLLEGFLDDPMADRVTGDDKTLVIAIRKDVPPDTILADLVESKLEEEATKGYADASVADIDLSQELAILEGRNMPFQTAEFRGSDQKTAREQKKQESSAETSSPERAEPAPTGNEVTSAPGPEAEDQKKPKVKIPASDSRAGLFCGIIIIIVLVLSFLIAQSNSPESTSSPERTESVPIENEVTSAPGPEAEDQKKQESSAETSSPERAESAPTGNDETHTQNQGGQSRQKKTLNEKNVNGSNAVAGDSK
jgi:hypothetical protein